MTTYLYEYDMLIIFPALSKTSTLFQLVQTLVRIVSPHSCGIFYHTLIIVNLKEDWQANKSRRKGGHTNFFKNNDYLSL